MKPLGRNRWTFFYDGRPDGDRLTHSVLATYGSGYEQIDVAVYPNEGITECGVLVKLYPASKGRAKEGVYISDDHMLTCIRCLSGCSTDGVSFRAEQKNLLFAQRYGMKGKVLQTVTGRTPYPGPQIPLQNLPPSKRLVSVFDEAQNVSLDEYQAIFAAILAPLHKP